MKRNYKNIIIYESHFDLMREMTDDQAGSLIKAIGLFGLGQEPQITDPLVLGIWKAIRRDFVIQAQNYQSIVERNRTNGRKGGAPKGNKNASKTTQNNPNNPNGLENNPNNPNNLKDKDKDIVLINSNINSNTNSSVFSHLDYPDEVDDYLDKLLDKKIK